MDSSSSAWSDQPHIEASTSQSAAAHFLRTETRSQRRDPPADHVRNQCRGSPSDTKDVLAEEQMIVDDKGDELYYRTYRNEQEDLGGIAKLVDQELSEPYNIYTFRYFLVEWPHLTFLVFPSISSIDPIATIICKQESHRGKTNRGYIGMLSVDQAWRRRGIATKLVKLAIAEMASRGAQEIVLETEYDNASSLALYDSLGFMREKRIQRFYSNLKDAFRLILPLPAPQPPGETASEAAIARAALSTTPEHASITISHPFFSHHDDLYT